MKHWQLLDINPNLAEIFQSPPILPFRRNKNLRYIIGTKLIQDGKVKRNLQTKYKVNVQQTTSFLQQSLEATKQAIFQIYQKLNYKSKYVIYLLEFTKCKIQYVGIAAVCFWATQCNNPLVLFFKPKNIFFTSTNAIFNIITYSHFFALSIKKNT